MREPGWDRTAGIDRLLRAGGWLAAVAVAIVLALIVADLVQLGRGRLSWSFLVDAPRRSGRSGGIAPILVSTALILATCLAVALPIGIGAGILLASGAAARPPRRAGPSMSSRAPLRSSSASSDCRCSLRPLASDTRSPPAG